MKNSAINAFYSVVAVVSSVVKEPQMHRKHPVRNPRYMAQYWF